MAVLPEFREPGPPAYANAWASGMSQGLSIVERKQELRLREQRAGLQQMEFIAKLPLIQADTQLRIEQARSAIATGIQQTNLGTRAALEAPVAQAAFFKVMQSDDVANSEQYETIDPQLHSPEQQAEISARNEEIKKRATQTTLERRANQLSSLMAQYSYMKDLKDPGFSGFYGTLEKAYTSTNEQLHAFIQYGSLLDRAKLTSEATKEARRIGGEASRDVAVIGAEAKGNAAEVGASSRARQIIALETAADLAHQSNDLELEAELRAGITRVNALPAQKGARRLPPAVAATLGISATPATTPTTPAAPTTPSKSVEVHLPTVQTPAGPRPIPKGTKTIKVDGQEYPIAVDAQGNRVYYKDGDWLDLPARR